MSDYHVLHCIVQGPREVVRDIRRNKGWILGISAAIIVFIIVSSVLFYWAEAAEQNVKGETVITPFSSVYFTVINFTTVGFGDIQPKTTFGRVLAMINSVAGLVSVGWLVAVLTYALQPSQPTESAMLRTLVDALTRPRLITETFRDDEGGIRITIEIDPPIRPTERRRD